jgi:hypothetical protein
MGVAPALRMQACTGTLEKKTRHELSTRDWDKSPLVCKKCRLRKNGYWYFTILVTVLPHASHSKVRWS